MSKSGIVINAHGQRGFLEANGENLAYLVPRRDLRVVCGDEVRWDPQADGEEVLVRSLKPRRSALIRPDARGRAEVLVANLDQVLVVLAPVPEPDPFLADRYLCAGTLSGCDTGIVFNKIDLNEPDPACLDEFVQAGYPVIRVSAQTGEGLDQLASHLQQGTSVMVGQSGVGKSSLFNALIPEAEQLIGGLGAYGDEGTHTTSASAMFRLPGGGRIIDSPGVREFQPVIDDPRSAQEGFPEISALATQCRFSDCSHMREPDCAVRDAVETGDISPRRYESYRRVKRTADQEQNRRN